ncbi:EAL domain-containing protein [Thalassomonas sp. M1454]|uniref:EAL domain-containing protein n=1 Tax=Thalassomonas sp. M1454 TaxID=2594477 RepID=UPI001180007C|nr:EAL domain-containing protein [Thalassomonas sp. M1454]TRX57378.1 EAL domain-containing protein [Thalassomonas sp. M1454]
MQFIKNNNKNISAINFLKFLLALCITSISLPSFAVDSQAPLKFQQFSTEQGLSQASVYSITQDQEGFIWIATQDGLNRYDGYEFIQYRNNLNNPNSLPNNLIRVVFVDSENTMWVGTQNGLSKYNSKLDSFENFFHEKENLNSLKDNTIWNIFEDASKNIWISTSKGLQQYNQSNNNFIPISFRSFQDDLQEIKAISQDSKGNYWLGTYENGLFVMNKSLNSLYKLNGNNKWHLNIDSKRIFQFTEIDNNHWIGTDNGIYIVDQSYNLIEHKNLNYLGSNFNNVRSIHQLNENIIWIGTESGLLELNLNDNIVTKLDSKDEKSKSNKAGFIYTIFEDSSKSVWFGTIYNGAVHYNPSSSMFNHYLPEVNNIKINVLNFIELMNDQIWISTEFDGIYFLDKTTEKIYKSNIEIDSRVTSISASKDGNIWILTNDNELYHYNRSTDQLENIISWHKKTKAISDRKDIISKDDVFWFGSKDSSIYKYSVETHTLKKISLFPSTKKIELSTLSFRNDDELWIFSSEGELFVYSILNDTYTKRSIPKNKIFQENRLEVVKETEKFLWFGFWNQGILLLNKETQKYTHFHEETGLSNNFIAGLILDHLGNAWVSTNKGLNVINPSRKTLKTFTTSHGVQADDFIAHSYLRDSNGTLYFGGINGFNSFHPMDLNLQKEFVSKPILTKLLISNNEVKITENKNKESAPGELYTKLLYMEHISLKHNQSPFSFEFTSPNSTTPSLTKYRYKLVGLDDDWIYTDSDNKRASYTNLGAGDYIFNLEAFSSQSNIYKAAKPLRITILPPWWLTKTAWLLYALCIFTIIYYFIQQAKNKEKTNIQIKESEERLKLALWGSGDEMWDWNMVTNQMYRSNIWGTLDFPKEDSNEGGSDGESHNIHPQDHDRVKETLEAHKANKTEHYEAAYRVKNKDGKWIWVLDRGKVVERDSNNEPIRMTGTLKDISQIKQTEESLKLFAKCIENISDAVVVYDSQFKIVDCNLSFQRITGQNRSEAMGKPLEFNSYPMSFLQNLKKNLIHHGSWQGEIESTRSNGEDYLIDITLDIIRDENDKISHFVGVFSDITERKETEEELRKLANSDTLTGLPNRSFFQANQSQLVSQDAEHALLVFDLDNFKKINDSLSHQIGDVLLCKVTERIATITNHKNTFYRLGGDEFSLIIEGNNDIHNITSIADEILNVIAEPYFIRNQEIALSCSIGIALFPDDGSNSHELLKNADTAMYHAKDKGGDTYQFFNDSMNKQAVKRLQIENLIRHGLKEDLFSVYYQPKIDVKSGKIRGMEALVRFEAGQKGIIRPDIFIPISEETGQIIEIGEVVLRKACLATKAWIDNGMFNGRIAVNLSAVQFRQPNLVQIINEVLAETKLPAKYLELEITEGTVMDSPQEAIKTMLQIRELGIHLSLDDFGTGYSSLAYLKKFPLNTLKIDKAFVDDLEDSEEGRNMVATIITIAHNLGMDVVAEGVETESQLNHLKALNCEQLQGYLYSRPLSEEDFGRYLLSHIITNKSTPYSNI